TWPIRFPRRPAGERRRRRGRALQAFGTDRAPPLLIGRHTRGAPRRHASIMAGASSVSWDDAPTPAREGLKAVGEVILLSLTASLNPTLVAATTVMLMLDKPVRLMMGYLLGAYITSITIGLVIVFSLSDS